MGLACIHNEREILEQVANGCREAFGKLYYGYLNQASRIVYTITGSREHTEEIIQELFVKLWKNREKLADIERFNAYFYILLRNHTLNYLTGIARERKKLDQYIRVAYTGGEQSTDPLHGRLDILDQAIDALPAQQRTVFLLRAQGYRNPEIATQMNLSADSVKKYNQLALKSIHRFMKVSTTVLFTMAAAQFLK